MEPGNIFERGAVVDEEDGAGDEVRTADDDGNRKCRQSLGAGHQRRCEEEK